MTIRYPAPLGPGDRIGVTAPSAGVTDRMRPRLTYCLDVLRRRGFEVEVGRCLDGSEYVSAPAADRAAELTSMLVDPAIRAVVPPWGGELAIDLLDLVDWDAVATAEPTWLVGFSDISTLMTPLTLRAGIATVHGQNLMDTPYAVPAPLRSWLDVVTLPASASFTQGPAALYRAEGYDDFVADPTVDTYSLDTPGGWVRLDSDEPVHVSGRLIGGCIETIANLSGTPYGDLASFTTEHAPDGLIAYVEAAEAPSFEIGRRLHGMRLAGWFDDAQAVLVGRTRAPGAPGYSQPGAVLDALGGLGVPIIAGVECGHVPPHLTLVNGASATVTWSPGSGSITQSLT